MKPILKKHGRWWWCKGLHIHTGRGIMLHGATQLAAYNNFINAAGRNL